MSTNVIAIDGPSGSGKSSTSRGVASRLGYDYLDTGSMYRAMAWAMLQRGVDTADAAAIAEAARDVVLEVGTDPAAPAIRADGVDVSGPIRETAVTDVVSPVAAVPEVRAQLVDLQRATIAAAPGGIVVEGRDIGTTVAPDAPVKIFLVADPVARARRRAAELGHDDDAAMQAALAERDRIDSTRAASPLAQADDAVVVDGTDLSLDEVIDRIVALARG